MFRKSFGVLVLLASLAFPAMAQEGHPLAGTWQGEWGAAAGEGNFLTIIMYWDGKTVTGLVNPGPDSTMLQSAELDSAAWTVRLETDLKDEAGTPVHLVADGRLENIGSQTRTITGTWQHEGGSGTFTLTRQSGA